MISRHLVGAGLISIAALFPFVLFMPLLMTRVSFVSYHEIFLAQVSYDLFFKDKFLFIVVFVFGIVTPAVKMILSILCWYKLGTPVATWIGARLTILSKLSMLDIMLLAIFIVIFKGVGIAVVEIRYGLYVYTGLVVASLVMNLIVTGATERSPAKNTGRINIAS